MTSLEIELAVANLFDFRKRLIIPNISWGMGIHECDLLMITKSGHAMEIEIKTSAYDLGRNLKKHYGHKSKLIKRLFFAIPESLNKSRSRTIK